MKLKYQIQSIKVDQERESLKQIKCTVFETGMLMKLLWLFIRCGHTPLRLNEFLLVRVIVLMKTDIQTSFQTSVATRNAQLPLSDTTRNCLRVKAPDFISHELNTILKFYFSHRLRFGPVVSCDEVVGDGSEIRLERARRL